MSVRLLSRAITLVKLNNNLMKDVSLKTSSCCCQKNYFSAKPSSHVVVEIDPSTGEPKKKKVPIIPKITLLHGDDLTVTTLEEAQKISKRRDLKLVKILDLDTKTERPVYKLMTPQEYNAEDIKHREQKKKQQQSGALKGEKVVLLSHSITEHDLQTHINKILKWLSKMYEVRVVINGDTNISKATKPK
ncbi:unnamed protein product [Callosobruchus maculatus]|uniref:Translation initiation factor 3 N-terminal domain-containing protein n=1 Tax=Callosobruchus maculatus TaxID=64391 RepID=A0A653DSI8_CALMS|nr:unnamed protein product [Callosobruchus maculatus]